jgi:ATP-dependent Clp protease protease subunit
MHKIRLQGEIDGWGYARNCLAYELSQAPEGEQVVLEVDSLGGDVMEAISISNMLKERGNITAHIVGFCASAATWLVYGCDKVVINDDCAFLIHKCSSYVDAWGMMNADEIEALIEKLKSEKKSNEAIDLIIAQKYVKHSNGKMDMKAALKLMREERWMLPSEALELGLVDEVSEEHALTNLAARCHVVNAMKSLPNLPDGIFAAKPQPKNAAEVTEEPQVAANEAAAPVEERRSVVQRLRDALTEIFGGSVAMVEQQPAVANSSYSELNALLGVESIEERGSQADISVGQLSLINARLAELADHVALLRSERDAISTERDIAIADFSNAIAAIDGISEAVAAIDTVEGKVAAIKDALSNAAGCSTETHASNAGDGHAEDVVLDGVNSLVAQYRR